MLRPVLGDLNAQVGGVHDILSDAVDFVSEDHGVAPSRLAPEILQLHGVLGLLRADDGPALALQAPHEGERVAHVFPRHAVLGAQRRLVDLRGGRHGADAAEPDLVGLERVGRAEGAADVVRAADVVQHQHQTGGREFAILLRLDPAQLDI